MGHKGAVIGLFLLFMVLGGSASAAEIEVVAELTAEPEAPAIDGKVDSIWQRAAPLRFTLSEGSQGSVEVTLRALRSESHLYLLFQWPDKTESLNRYQEFDGKGWKSSRGREDRLNIAWNIGGSVQEFEGKGCSVLCHKTEGVMKTNAPGEKVDLWYWMAQRVNPVGVADDWVITNEPALVEGAKSGRRPDAPGGGPYEPNWNETARRPAFMFAKGVRPGPALIKKGAVETGARVRFRPGDRLPREALALPSGPRAGIEAKGIWERQRWTVELRRALITGDGNDIQFSGLGPFYFAVSIHDDAEKDEHAQMGRDVLRLNLK